MNVHHILCPIDYSEGGHFALNYAASLAKESDADLHIVYCCEEVPPYETGFGGAILPPIDLDAELRELEKIVPTKENVRYQHKVLKGSPVDELVKYAEDHEIDLIVMGTHGRTGLSRLLMGSVAEGVLRRSPCPVLTIRQHAKQLETADE